MLFEDLAKQLPGIQVLQETLPLRFVIFRPLKTTYKLNAIDESLHTGVHIFVPPESRDAGTAHAATLLS